MKKRKGTPLSLYYPSVTGLLGSCYGYGDSRLSVLLTIAHKGGIQLWATMQISLSRSLFSFYNSSCLHLSFAQHLPFPFSALPLFISQNFTEIPLFPSPPKPPPPSAVWCFYTSFHPLLFSTLQSHPYLHHHRKEIIPSQTVKCNFSNSAIRVENRPNMGLRR